MGFKVRCVLITIVVMVWVRSASGLDPRGALGQYGRQVWQTDNGLPQNTVHAIVQTPDGYIWLGTDDGLVRFNGIDFKVFTAENSAELRSSTVEGLTVDQAGGLWIVTSGGLSVYRNGVFRGFGVADGLPDPKIWFAHQDHAGRLWVATAGGLCLIHTNRCQAPAAGHGINVTQEERFAEAPDGSVWVADSANTVHLTQGLAGWVQSAMLKTPHGEEITVQVVAPDGQLLVGTAEGLETRQLDAQHGTLVPVAIANHAGRLPVLSMLRAFDGSIWLGTSAGLAHGAMGHFAMFPSGSPQPKRPRSTMPTRWRWQPLPPTGDPRCG